MQDFCKFLVDYWKPIFGIFMCLVSLIITIFRKRPSCNYWSSIREMVLSVLPTLIVKAEKSGLSGEGKKNYVLNEAWKLIEMSYSNVDEETSLDLTEWLSSAIEDILSTPRKKD